MTDEQFNATNNEEIKVFEEKSYDVPYTTMNVGIINGGSAKNSVSANCNAFSKFFIALYEVNL